MYFLNPVKNDDMFIRRSGRTNTIYAWDTPMPDGKEPQLWFHDIYRKDGTPFSKDEEAFIRKLCK